MKLAIASDEISRDFETAVEIGVSWGLTAYEIRRLRTGRVPRVDDEEIEEVGRIRDDHGLTIPTLSPGLFKIEADHPEVEQRIAEDLPRACRMARELGADALIDFAFRCANDEHDRECPQQVIDLLGRIAGVMQENGCRFFLENEHVCRADTGLRTAAIVERVGHPNLFVNWDPANASHFDETAFPNGYEAVRKYVAHVHVKDFNRDNDRITVVPGEGGTNWTGQIRALAADGYDGWLVVETHMRPHVDCSRRCVAAVKRMIGELAGP